MSVRFCGIRKRFGTTVALDGVDLEVREGEFLALLGPSGSGKTTLLRIIAGLEQPDAGSLFIDGRDALELAPRARRIGFVFQHYALFRHMSVFDNIAFGLTVRPRHERPAPAEIAERVRTLLAMVQLDGLEARFPSQLSGGQRQRVALARALAVEPRVLLLDEPFGALDAKVRVELRHRLRELQERFGLTTLFVTHDQEEALSLADRVAILNRGRIEQVATPDLLYDRPATAFVMGFLGEVNRFEATIRGGRLWLGGQALAPVAGLPDGPVTAFVRPHEVTLRPASDESGAGTARVLSLAAIGPRARLHLDHEGQPLEVEAERATIEALGLAPGARVGIRFAALRLFPAGAEGTAEAAPPGPTLVTAEAG